MSHLNYHHLWIFYQVASHQSFSLAAQHLSIAQSAVTKQVQSLEEQLQLTLLDRSNKKKPRLTEAGVRIFEYADSIFRTGKELLDWSKTGQSKEQRHFRIGAVSSLSRNLQFEFLKPLLLDPKNKVDVLTGDPQKLLSLLRESKIDLFLTTQGSIAQHEENVFSHKIHESPFVLCLNKDTRRASLAQALKDGIFLPSRSFESRVELDGYLEKLNLPYTVRGEIEDIALLRLCALRTGSLVAIPKIGVAQELSELKILSESKSVRQKFYAVTRQKKWNSKKLLDLFSAL